MSYNKDYNTSKPTKTQPYSEEELEEIRGLIKMYFKKKYPDTILNTNEGNYLPLVDAVNAAYDENIITTRFVCDIYNQNCNTQRKSIKKMSSIADYIHGLFVLEKDGIEKKDTINNFKGAELINSSFKNKLKATTFTFTEFYTAKQSGNCQWVGILNGWDVIRKDYEKIKIEVINSFSVSRQSKVSAVIQGSGGSGKSTLLRRLAFDLIGSEIIVIWLSDAKKFIDLDLKIINENVQVKYLLIIEDWNRLISSTSFISPETFLHETFKLENIRIAIGDRSYTNKNYLDFLYANNIFELLSNENEQIIKKICTYYPVFNKIINVTFSNPDSFKTPLYLILFVLVRLESQENRTNEVDFNDIISYFRSIVRDDIKQLAKFHPGIAKALFHWACMYKINKVSISIENFKILIKYFDKNFIDPLNDFSPSVWNILSKYMSKTEHLNPKLVFNHDSLAEEGLSYCIQDDWYPFDDYIFFDLLNSLKKSTFYFALNLFEKSLYDGQFIYKDESSYSVKVENSNYLRIEKFKFILDLISNYPKDKWENNFDFWFISFEWIGKNCDRIECNILASKLIEIKVNYELRFLFYLSQSWVKIEHKLDKIFEILNQDTFMDYFIPELYVINELLWEKCKRIIKSQKEGQDFIIRLLASYNKKGFVNAETNILHYCLLSLFQQHGNSGLFKQLISNNLPHILRLTATEISKYPFYEYGKTHDIISKYFSLMSSNEEREKIAISIIELNGIRSEYRIVLYCIKILMMNFKYLTIVENTVSSVIKSFNSNWDDYAKGDDIDARLEFQIVAANEVKVYYGVLKLPFHSIESWRKDTLYIIDNWSKLSRKFIASVIEGYKSDLTKTLACCYQILSDWKNEINQTTINNSNYQHIIYSLSHPNLKEFALQKSTEMFENADLFSERYHQPIFEIIEKIVSKNEFPSWFGQ